MICQGQISCVVGTQSMKATLLFIKRVHIISQEYNKQGKITKHKICNYFLRNFDNI